MSVKMKRILGAAVWLLIGVGFAGVALGWHVKTGSRLMVVQHGFFAFLCLLVFIRDLIVDRRVKLMLTMTVYLLFAAFCAALAFWSYPGPGGQRHAILFGLFACVAIAAEILRFWKEKQE